ncbi:Chromate resistance protein ChrB [Sphingomonas oligophenolica]|uniref:Chromate resistance protein ChrB n=1 Tax=Sphingomonas oligophenolica TaxID=301154 RepID=A0A502CHW0_9SPHN|nr:Chromate resistance protein ChrB [Sphingomonas oligophenolica]TPG12767.1 chromate resistance protein ChrB [Sphingomonas oligophenolica]
MQIQWLLFTYKIPAEPAAGRVGVWRRLKGMGAVYLQSGVCLLPKTDDHIRRLKMLEHDAMAMGGEAVLLETFAFDAVQEAKVLTRFRADRDDQYREFIGKCDAFEAEIAKEFAKEKFTYAELEEEDADLRKLQGWIEKIRKLDFYDAPLGVTAADQLVTCEAALARYAERVFEVQGDDA